MADVLLHGTIVISIAAYAGAEWLRFRGGSAGAGKARMLWTTGALLCLGHVAAAFHVRHGWSHADAYQDTARQTAALTGLDWGGGLFINYLFVAVWIADAAWWWLAPGAYRRRSARMTHIMTAFFLFMFLNAAVVFATGAMRALGTAAVLLVAFAWYGDRGKRTHRAQP